MNTNLKLIISEIGTNKPCQIFCLVKMLSYLLDRKAAALFYHRRFDASHCC